MDNILLRSANTKDLQAILDLNEEAVQYTAPMDLERLESIFKASDLCCVAEVDGKVVAFFLALLEGKDYDGINYKWFLERYEKLLYIDRIAVSEKCKGHNIGTMLYEKAFEYARTNHLQMLAAEINIEPPNLTSLKFHKKFGFSEVGKLASDDNHKVVSLQVAYL